MPSQVAALPTVIAKLKPQRSLSSSSQPASFLIVDDKQFGPSRQLMFALSPTKTFNPPPVTSIQVEESQHNASGYQVFSGVFHPYCSTSRSTHHNHLHLQNFNQHRHQCQLPLTQQEPARPLNQSSQQSQSKSAD